MDPDSPLSVGVDVETQKFVGPQSRVYKLEVDMVENAEQEIVKREFKGPTVVHALYRVLMHCLKARRALNLTRFYMDADIWNDKTKSRDVLIATRCQDQKLETWCIINNVSQPGSTTPIVRGEFQFEGVVYPYVFEADEIFDETHMVSFNLDFASVPLDIAYDLVESMIPVNLICDISGRILLDHQRVIPHASDIQSIQCSCDDRYLNGGGLWHNMYPIVKAARLSLEAPVDPISPLPGGAVGMRKNTTPTSSSGTQPSHSPTSTGTSPEPLPARAQSTGKRTAVKTTPRIPSSSRPDWNFHASKSGG